MTHALLLLVLFVFLNYFLILVTDLSFGRSVSLSYITCVFLLFLSTVVSSFSMFKYFLILFFVVMLALSISRKRLTAEKLIHAAISMFKPGFAVFTLLFFWLYYVDRNAELTMIDDFLRWGGMVRDCMTNNVLYTTELPVMIKAGSYPPFTTLICVLFNKAAGYYSESWSLFGVGSFCIALTMPVADRLEWKKSHILWMIMLPFLIILVLLGVQMDAHMQYPAFIFNCTYVDWVMSLLTASGLYQVVIFEDRAEDYFSFCLTMSALLLTDRIGFAFAMLCAGTLFFRILMTRQMNQKSFIKFVVFCLGVPALIYGCWYVYVQGFIRSGAAIAPAELLHNAAESPDVSYRDIVKENYLRALTTDPVMTRPFKLNYVGTILLLVALLFLYGMYRKDRVVQTVAVLFAVGGAAYALTMLVGYMYLLSEYEATGLAAYGRYMQTYTYAGYVTFLMLMLKGLCFKEGTTAAVVGLLCLEPLSLSTILPKTEADAYRASERSHYENYIRNEYNGERLLVVNQTDMEDRQFIRYLFGADGSNVSYFQGNDFINSRLENFTERLEKNELILIAEYDDIFYERYWSALTDEELYNTSIYRIIKKENGFDFEPIYIWTE